METIRDTEGAAEVDVDEAHEAIEGAAAVGTELDAEAWLVRLAEISDAIPGCGGVAELVSQRFTAAVDEEIDTLPEEHQDAARAIARFSSYADGPVELDDDEACCQHGVDFWTCPAGRFG